MTTIRLPCHLQAQYCQAGKATPFAYPSYPSFSWKKKKNAVQRFLIVSSGAKADSGFTASDAIVEFYDCINRKKLRKMKELISNDCCFEDYSFVKPFRGRKEVVHFFQHLTDSMGSNTKFVIQDVCQGGDHSRVVAITWHLEWKGYGIPFTRGCSFYVFSEQGDRLVIEHARAMTESPIKPGDLVLTLLKVVTYLFDEFPGVAEKFLEKPHVILEFLQRVYTMFLEPFVRPVLEFYIIFWKFIARMLGYVLAFLLHISNIFLK